MPRAPPEVVALAVGLAVPDVARAGLVQVLCTVRTLEALRVPLQVRRYAHDVLVVDLTPAAHAHRDPPLLCTNTNILKSAFVVKISYKFGFCFFIYFLVSKSHASYLDIG